MRPYPAEKRFREHLAIAYLLAVLTGLVMIYSTSSIIAESRFGSHFFFLKQQLMWFAVSVVVIWFIYKLDLKKIAVYSAPATLLLLLMLSLVFLMPARNGSHRWLMLGPFTAQPSELFKFMMIVYLSFSLSNPKRNIADLKQLLFPYVPMIGLGLVLILMEPDLGTTIVIFVTAISIFCLAGARMKHMLMGLTPLVGIASFVVFVLGYKKTRILDYLAAVGDPLQGSYQAKQAALTLGAGGLMGTGLGEGRQKLFFLPYPHTDFIFAATGEEIGLIGLTALMALLFYMLLRGMKIAAAQPDKFGFLLASGMTVSLFFNIAINLGVVTSLLPVTGLALPFVSYGGSSLLISSAAIGVLLNLSKRMVPGQWQTKRSG
ncbi:MAG: cell division protein FtsW [candidate division Zixibacteria bacterium]|jgi:cell division protein FtsW|nr:cell division protein FtsW [candidate division Zixibacteria bacterium]